MKVGLQINRFDFPGGDAKIYQNLKNICAASEAAGLDSLWVMDHFFQIEHIGDYKEPMMEAYTTLGFIAGITSKVKLGTMVTGVIYREPAVLIKAVTTLDDVSNGRAYFGIGAGWNDQEAKALGLTDPLNSRRFDRLEDTLKLALQMWKSNSASFKGKVYNLPEPYLSPQPVSKPHPPILIGGGGEQKTLRYVAEYADACNLFARDPEMLKHKLEVLKKHCQDIGRDYLEIEKTVLAGISVKAALENTDNALNQAKNLKNLGIDHVIYAASQDADPKVYEKFKPIVEQLHRL